MNTSFKLLSAALLLGMAAFVGCKKEDKKSPAAKIAGTYLVKDTVFYTPPNSPGFFCSPAEDKISGFGIVITAVNDNTVTINGFKNDEPSTASVTNTTLVIPEELGQAINVTGTISGNTIRLEYQTGSSSCFINGRATAVKQE